MRLPQPLIESHLFAFEQASHLLRAISDSVADQEKVEIERLSSLGLPPVTSVVSLSTMIGVNPGLTWSLIHRNRRHYRTFEIPKGRGFRKIVAPKVALKIVQKWISFHLAKVHAPMEHVHGFVPGRSHVTAAACHLKAGWVLSFDLRNFFPSTPSIVVETALMEAGYSATSAQLVASLCCLGGFLPQGAPTSPVLSNMCMRDLDVVLAGLANQRGLTLTRYADDITFSGFSDPPGDLIGVVEEALVGTPWQLEEKKTSLRCLPDRLKVHGLLVHGERVRLTKGYRNKVRLYRHFASKGFKLGEEKKRYAGHMEYARFIEKFSKVIDQES